MRSVFEYENHKNTAIILPIWDFASQRWLEGNEVIMYKTLLGAMHPGIEMCIGQVPTVSELKNDQKEINKYIERMKAGVPFHGQGASNFRFDFSGGSRTHGRGFYTAPGTDIGVTYFGQNNSMGYVNYGSILVTECRKITSAKLNVLIVDDEEPLMRKAGLGDSHGKVSQKLLINLSEGVKRQDPNGEPNTPIQVRVGFVKEFLFKGTVVSFPDNKIPKEIADVHGSDWDAILPLSGIKGNKPAKNTQLIDKLVYFANVHFAEKREAVGSQQFWMWFTPKAIKADVLPGLESECAELRSAIDNPEQIYKVFSNIEKMRQDIGYVGEIDPESWEADDDAKSPIGDKIDIEYVDPVETIIAADKKGVLIQHPWITSKITNRLARRWKRLALNTHIKMKSFMAMPDDSIPKDKFVCGDLPAGYHIVFRNPILHYGSIKILENIHGKKYKHYLKQRGTMFISHTTAANSQGDFDGDYFTVVPLNKQQSDFADEMVTISEDPGYGGDAFAEYIKSEEPSYGKDTFKHIIFEIAMQEYLWGDTPIVIKPKKSKVEGGVEEVFYNSMDNIVGIVSNMIQHAKANNTYNKIVTVQKHDLYTDTYLDGTEEISVIAFLTQQMQVAVDRLKNQIYHNMLGIEVCRKVIEEGKKPSWLNDRAYKDSDAYKKKTIPIGIVKKVDGEWVTDTDEAFPGDVVSLTIGIVNNYWKSWKDESRHVSEFQDFFPQDYDSHILGNATTTHRWYGLAMKSAATIGKEFDGSDPEPWRFLETRKKAMRVVREQADDIKVKFKHMNELLTEAVEEKGPGILPKMWGDNDPSLVREVYKGFYQGNPTGVVKLDGKYKIATTYHYAAALWHACHKSNAAKESQGSSVFKIYLDEIVEQLGKQKDEFGSTVWFNSNKFALGDFIYGNPSAKAANDSDSEARPRIAQKVEGDNTIYMPSRINKSGLLADVNQDEGYIVPNSVQIMVERDGVNSDREGSTRYYIYIRSSENKSWQKFGIVGTNKPVPELLVPLEAQLFTTRLTKNAEPLMRPGNESISRFRSAGGVLKWKKNK